MNIFRVIYYKWLIKKSFKKEYVDTGYVRNNFKVNWDGDKQDFCIVYEPLHVKNINDIEEPEVIDESEEIVKEL